jgi:hypothetical protein
LSRPQTRRPRTEDDNAALEILAGIPKLDGKALHVMSLYRTRIAAPTGMLGGVLAVAR